MEYGNIHQFSWYRGDVVRSNMSDDIDIYYCTSTNYRAFKINRNIIGEKNLDYAGDYSFLKGGYGIYFLYKIEQTSKNQTLHIYVGKAEDRSNPHGMDRIVEHVLNDEKLGMKYHNKWNKALYITVKEDKENPEFTPGIVAALESQFIQMFKSLESSEINKDINVICYNSKIGGQSNEPLDSYKTSIYAIIALMCHNGIGIIPDNAFKQIDDEVRIREFESRVNEINQLKAELISQISEVKNRSIDENTDYIKYRVIDRFKKALELYRDLGIAIINNRVYSAAELSSYKKSSNVLTKYSIANDMVDLTLSKCNYSNQTYLALYSKDGVFIQVLIDKTIEDNKERPRDNQIEALRNLISKRIFIVAPTSECYNLTMKNILSKYSDEMARIDSGWALDIDNLVLPNIIKIDNMNTLVKTTDGREFIREQIEKEFNRVKFDVVIGNPPYNNDIYLDFVTLGDQLAEKYLCMITPAKWQAKGGEKNDAFRKNIVPRMSDIVYYPDAFELFNIREQEGITYFIIDKEEHLSKHIDVFCKKNNSFNSSEYRNDVLCTLFGGYTNSIIKKFKSNKMMDSVINDKSATFVDLTCRGELSGEIPVYSGDSISGYVDRADLKTLVNLDKYKITTNIMPVDVGFDKCGQMFGLSRTYILKPNEVPKGSFIVLICFNTEKEALSFQSYCNTLPIRFLYLVGLCGKAMSDRFWRFIPMPDNFDHIFTDDELYKKYNLTTEEINVIKSIIKERN